jgi:hypothetical protein
VCHLLISSACTIKGSFAVVTTVMGQIYHTDIKLFGADNAKIGIKIMFSLLNSLILEWIGLMDCLLSYWVLSFIFKQLNEFRTEQVEDN